MSRRIDVELTSARSDGSWTWRAAGAREPKGVVEANLVPGAAKVGDVLRVEADFDVEGITVVSVVPAKGSRREPERIELLGASADFEPVTSTLVAKGERRDRDRDRDRDRPRPGRPAGDRPRRDGDRGADRGRGGPDRDRSRTPRPDSVPAAAPAGAGATTEARARRPHRERPARPPKPDVPAKPKPARLRPGRKHRNELVRSLPAEQQPIAEQALRGGLPAVRQALDEQNAKLRTEDKPEIKPDGVVSIAEELLPRLRVAEWLDRAESARADIDQLDLGDLRSVVVASDDAAVARDETTRDLAAELKQALVRRQDEAHHEWLAELTTSLNDGRSVRALRLSSRPPKAGAVFPPDLRTRLGDAAAASLTPDASADRWVAVLEALAYSPVRSQVKVEHPPSTVTDELKATVARLASLLPDVARTFGIEPPPPGSRPPRPPRRTEQRRGAKPTTKTVPPPPAATRERERVEPSTPVAAAASSSTAPELIQDSTPAAVDAPRVDDSVAVPTPEPETVAAAPDAEVAAAEPVETPEPVEAPEPPPAVVLEEPEASAPAVDTPEFAAEPEAPAPAAETPQAAAVEEPDASAPAVDTPESAAEPEASAPAAETPQTAAVEEPEAVAPATESAPEPEAAAAASEPDALTAETPDEPEAAPEPEDPAPAAETALEPERGASEPTTTSPADARADVDATTNGTSLGESNDAGEDAGDVVVPAAAEVADEVLAPRTPSPPDA